MARRGRPKHPDILTPREWEVLALLREHLTNDQIARRLGITAEGVKYHVSEILSKVGVSSREEAARWQPGERRPWWATLPLFLRPRLGWLSPAVAGALAVAVAAGIGVLVWALMAVDGGNGTIAGSSLLEARVPIAAGQQHTCVVTQGGGVTCWGSNQYGQLGNGTRGLLPTRPVTVVGIHGDVVAVATGGAHTCALTDGGTVKCWGHNDYGQLGDRTNDDSPNPVAVQGIKEQVAAIAAGQVHTCALTVAGSVKCWGGNSYGQLGDGTTDTHLTPVDVVGLGQGVITISASGYHTCALNATRTVKCWGRDREGELGDGAPFLSTEQQRISKTPLDVKNEDGTLLTGVAAISAGGGFGHTCALPMTGTVKCWGSNAWGELGDGVCGECGPWARAVAVDVSALTDVVGLSAGGTDNAGGHTCAITREGQVYCWGRGYSGQLGDGIADNANLGGSNVPEPVVGISGAVIAVAAGNEHTCAVMETGTIKCWGLNSSRQLGSGTEDFSNLPIDVPNVLAAVP